MSKQPTISEKGLTANTRKLLRGLEALGLNSLTSTILHSSQSRPRDDE